MPILEFYELVQMKKKQKGKVICVEPYTIMTHHNALPVTPVHAGELKIL